MVRTHSVPADRGHQRQGVAFRKVAPVSPGFMRRSASSANTKRPAVAALPLGNWRFVVKMRDGQGSPSARASASSRRKSATFSVTNVLGDECPLRSDGSHEHLVVRRTLEAPVVGIMKRNDIVAACSELLGHGGGVHLVKEKPQPRSCRSRSSVCSCRSPSSSTMAMKRSTSSGYSA